MDVIQNLSLGAILGALGLWITWWKNERSIGIKQITQERKHWRAAIKRLSQKIAYAHAKKMNDEGRIAVYRSELATNINPIDPDDIDILEHFDGLFKNKRNDIELFEEKIAFLLKHDWERSKWEVKSGIGKLWTKIASLFSSSHRKQLEWKSDDYRKSKKKKTTRNNGEAGNCNACRSHDGSEHIHNDVLVPRP